MALLEISNLERAFQAGEAPVKILKGLNLTIQAGEMVAIMGASGSGKSTLMNILGCLDRPTAGSYRVDGKETGSLDSDARAALRRDHFGFIFQSYHLLSHLDAVGNTEMPAVYAGVGKQDRLARAKHLLQRLGLEDRGHHRPSQLSGGQQQRVSIARSLMNGGEVILADEPTGALDSKSGLEMMVILRELHAQGHTIVLVTHDASIASQAQRIITIKDGEIVSDEPNPKAPFVATGKVQGISPSQTSSRWVTRFGLFLEAFRMAWLAMTTHRLRTFLTMLGIIIGITAVVSVVAVGQGAQQKVISDINAIGTNTIDIYPGTGWGDVRSGRVETLVPADLAALRAQIYVDSLTPNIRDSQELRYRSIVASASIQGVGAAYFRVKDIAMEQGRALLDRDVTGLSQVAVIDQNTKKKLFPGGENPIGETVLAGNVPIVIVGVAAEKDSAFKDENLNVWMPYTAVMYRISGQQYFSSITVRVADGMSNEIAQAGIEHLLATRHGTKDVFTRSSDSILKTVEKTTSTLTLLIASIAVISLVVGGIGVMNIMLVSVTERTREIGIRMAVGARQTDILQQFLIEAVMVCMIGGLFGILLSFGVGAVFSHFVSSISMRFSPLSIVLAFTCSTFIGVLFGFLPARNAARLDPIDALARE
ncbi:fused macrolide transporter subunits of ABC superfamily: ATP-binding component; membrane component [Desulfosarcina cetonica]|uniref:MacB family efflux pump subunit n=1 Tax=Desulfosarcina cetonica TaxID=90730 RepID=UPI0006D29A7B|nr:MacB family efflux pump subunit [Desulfosarcina cetonica]VTR68397.1 fused macrolide transporter subunits of ABC superfamily: ATP-binding component; membrane component [Desulfosarcina cetonica]